MKTKKNNQAAQIGCLSRLVLHLRKRWRIRRMKIECVSLGINGDNIKVYAYVDGEHLTLHEQKVGGSTLYLNSRESVYALRYPSRNASDVTPR